MNYNKHNKKLLLVVSSIIIFLLIISGLLVKFNVSLKFLSPIKDGYNYVLKIISTPITYLKNELNEYKLQKDSYKDNGELINMANKYDSLYVYSKELEMEIDELKKAINVNSVLSEKIMLNGIVINRNINNWFDSVIINKGNKDGLKEGMGVINNDGLIGKIVSCTNNTSTVRLLTSADNTNISVKIKSGDDYVYGLLSIYDNDNNLYKVEGISSISNIQKEQVVTTTGMGDIFPSGIEVGYVEDFISDRYDLNKIILVHPSVNFNNIGLITVLKRNVDL